MNDLMPTASGTDIFMAAGTALILARATETLRSQSRGVAKRALDQPNIAGANASFH